MKKTTSILSNLALIIVLMVSPAFTGKLLAQPPANTPVIEMTTSTSGTTVRIRMQAFSSNTPVWIETAPNTYTQVTVSTSWTGFTNYTPTGTSLKVHGALRYFDCSGTGSAASSRNPVSALNASGNTALQQLYCNYTNLTSLNLTGLTNLNYLSCYYGNFTSLNLTGLTNLQTLYCYNNQLTSLNLTGLTNLYNLNCSSNPLGSLNLTGLTRLYQLQCYSNQLTSLNLTNLPNLQYLYCYSNYLTSLNLTGLTKLRYLYCYSNQLTSLDLTGLTELYYLQCYSNQLTSLNLTGLTKLYSVYCYNNQITTLGNLTGLTALYYLYCYNNRITSLDLTGLTSLRYVRCYSNQISSLTLTGLTNLLELHCGDNQITGFDFTGLSALKTVECYGNPCTRTTYGIDTTYCNLPLKSTSDNAIIYVTTLSTPEPFVLATNRGNANDNNWKVYGRRGSSTASAYEITNTTGSYVCGTILVTDVTLFPKTLNLVVGESDSVFATVIPANAANKAISWSSSDTNVARVVAGEAEGSAVVTAGSRDGTAIVTVTTEDGGYTATCIVTVRIPVTGVRLDRSALTISTGESASLKSTVLPVNATNKSVTWSSSDTRLATVAAGPTAGSAVVTAGDTAGTSIITVTTVDGSFTATCLVTVTIPVTGVALLPTTLSLLAGETANIMATVLPVNATNQSLIWSSSDSSVALVAADGAGSAVVTAGYVDGTATIMVTTVDGSFTASCVVTVTIPVTGVTLNKKLTINVGESASLTATVLPVDASNKAVTWSSSDPSVVKVVAGDVAGSAVVTAVSDIAGKATITVTTEDGNFTASCVVTVTIPVSGVTLSPPSLSLVAGETGNISAALLPVDATNKIVTWSSDNPAVARVTVAHVSDVCIVRAINAGTATITVTTEEGSYTATCLVTVTGEAIPVYSVSVSPSSLFLKAGESRNIIATILPADATDKAVTWSSDNPDVATVNNAGKVTALSAGIATITVTTEDGNKTATCVVTVEESTVAVTGVILDKERLTIKKGESFSLTATVLPADATNKAVTWSSDNPDVATVDNAGEVTALSAGTATITVTTEEGNFTASCVVTVEESTVLVTGVTLDKERLTIKKGESFSLTATVLPADATNKAVTWSSDDPDVATVDNVGKVTALAVGKATITVTTEEGSFTATCAVTVEDDGSIEELISSGINVWTFDGVLHIDFKESILSDKVVSIFDMSGKLVYTNNAPSDELQIHLPSGVYIVKVGDIAFKVLITQ